MRNTHRPARYVADYGCCNGQPPIQPSTPQPPAPSQGVTANGNSQAHCLAGAPAEGRAGDSVANQQHPGPVGGNHEAETSSCNNNAAGKCPPLSWREAASRACALLDATSVRLYGNGEVYGKLEATRRALTRVVRALERRRRRVRTPDNAEAQQQQQEQHRVQLHLDEEDGILPGSLEAEVAAQLASHPGLAAAGPGQWLQLCKVVRPQFVRHRAAAAAAAAAAPATAVSIALEPSPSAQAPVSAAGRIADPDPPPIRPAAPSSAHPSLAALSAAIAQCGAALRRLAAAAPAAEAAPRLALHPGQAGVVGGWLGPGQLVRVTAEGVEVDGDVGVIARGAQGRLGTGRGGVGAVDGGSRGSREEVERLRAHVGLLERMCGWGLGGGGGAGRQQQPEEEWVSWEQVTGGGGEEGAGMGRRQKDAAQALYGPAEITLYGSVRLAVGGLLYDSTDEAREVVVRELLPRARRALGEAEAEQRGQGCVEEPHQQQPTEQKGGVGRAVGERVAPCVYVAFLTPEACWRLLEQHPDEGLRWQVHAAGPTQQVGVWYVS